MKRPVLILLNLAPILICTVLFWGGGWTVGGAAFLLQTALAVCNCRYAQRALETFLLDLLMVLGGMAGIFVGGVLYLAVIAGDPMGAVVLGVILTLDLLYSGMLALISTLWSWSGRGKKGTRRWARTLALLGIGVVLGCLLGIGGQLIGRPIGSATGALPLPAALMVLLLSMLAAILFHEMGHLVLGLAAGYRFWAFHLGPLSWRKENGKLRFRFQRVSGIGGACALFPPDPEGRGGRLAMIAGGVLANLLTGVGALCFPLTGAAKGAAQIFGLLSLIMGGINALPFYSGGNPTDGKQFWSQLFRTPEGERLAVYRRNTQRLMAGVRPRELEPLPPLAKDAKGPDIQAWMVGGYFRTLDGGDWEGAAAALGELEARLEEFPTLARPALLYELCCMACRRGERERAGDFRRQVRSALDRDEDMNGLRVRAYCAWYLDGNREEAKSLAARALEVEPLFPIPGQARMERELVTGLMEKLDREAEDTR